MNKRKQNQNQDQNSKVELAKKIANQSKNVKTAYDNVEETIFVVIRWISSLIDRVLFSSKHLSLVAFVLACFLVFTVYYDSENSVISKPLLNSKIMSNVPIQARYNSESFEISGLPSSCEVVLTGEAANVNNAATKNGYCQINLEGYTEGTHSINVSALGYGDNVTTTVTPSNITVTLKKITSRQFEIGYDFINLDKMDSKYILSTPEFASGTKVNIRASQDTLDSIVMVKALIDVEGKTGDFSSGATLVAYNKQGEAVKANINPSTIDVSVKVSSPHKAVPIVLDLFGEVPNGMAIESIALDHQTAVIYGSEAVLNTIEQVSIEYDASTLTGDTKVVQPLTLPDGVTSSDVSLITLDVKLSEAVTKTIKDVNINYRNNTNNYSAVDVSMTKVDVEITGTNTNVEEISAANLFVYIDLEGLSPGTYDLPLNIERISGNSYVKLNLKQKTLHITLEGDNLDEEQENLE